MPFNLCLHQNTSRAAGFRRSLEGWAKACIQEVELTAALLEEFLKSESLAAARRLLGDCGLTPVSGSVVLAEFWIPGSNRPAALDVWKRCCEQFASLGIRKIYCPDITRRTPTLDDYTGAADCIREAGSIAAEYQMIAMVEFTRSSPFIATLPTALKLIRAAGHPNVKPMLDCYHFWAGMSKFEDLHLLEPGELAHVHFQDVPDLPRELLNDTTRVIPGDGVAPLVPILQKLAEKGYAGPLSVELFLPEFTHADPEIVARRIRAKAKAVIQSVSELAPREAVGA